MEVVALRPKVRPEMGVSLQMIHEEFRVGTVLLTDLESLIKKEKPMKKNHPPTQIFHQNREPDTNHGKSLHVHG